MSPKRRTILRLLAEGKSYPEVCKRLQITAANLNSTVYQMRQSGAMVQKGSQTTRPLSCAQRQIMEAYAQKVPVPEIAARLGITCQTVLNHATQGFKRLGLTTPGIDRIALLRDKLGPHPVPPVTMDDAFFN